MMRFPGLAFFLFFATTHSFSQNIDWLLYTRTIRDAQGNFRFDQNVVSNFKLNKVVRMELGIRHGETSQAFDAYWHYKVELQTKFFWKTLRFFARISDNVIKSPTVYTRTNYLAIAESRFKVASKVTFIAGVGGVAQYQKDNVNEAAPILNGSPRFFPTYRFTFRYHFSERLFADAVYGAYDTFNPYLTNAPFFQVASEYELTKHVSLYGYFRYQYDRHIDVPFNDFLGLGVRVR
jgi:hypothetical protein